MLTDTLEALSPAQSRTKARSLLDELIQTLRAGRVDISPCRGHFRLGNDAQALLRELRALKEEIYELITGRHLQVEPRDMLLMSDWFAAMGEMALREENRRLNAMLEALPDHVALLDPTGEDVVYANRVAREDVANAGPLMEEFKRNVRPLADRAFKGEPMTLEVQFPSSGVSRWQEQHLTPVFGADGTLEAVAVSGRDIHARKEAEAFKEQMIGVLGHDLKNPVTAVKGLSALLLMEEDLPAKVRAGLSQIDRSARRMAELIETLLDFTHIRFHGTLPVSPVDMDLAEVCRSVVDELRAAHPGCDIRLVAGDKLPGRWDPARMAQLISNLVGNALVHGTAGAPVEVTLDGGDGRAILEVGNQGPAIPSGIVDRLFEPFQQGPNHGKSSGLGLGLYVVRQVVLAHRGTVGVQSTDNATRFSIQLPRD